MIDLVPLGDRAFLARFATEPEARAWAAAVRAQAWTGVVDIVLAYRSAAVFADPERCDLDALEHELRAIAPEPDASRSGRLVVLPVLYDGEDLPDVAQRLGRTVEEIIALHAHREYDVFAIGFQPGFPYAGYLPAELSGLARREVPRVRVPAGSVAIAGRQTGVYPAESPGGWHLLGRTPLQIVDVERGHFPIRAGDRLRFIPIDSAEYRARQGELLASSS
ncbi:MAG: 5-oxoprolinase subunit PxpB [Isosphaeraceae bacterium]|nr:5-oxoprolinase subunit PxpB [Isosphaeraceae bacterium]